MNTIDTYASLVTQQHRNRPKFIATLGAFTAPVVWVQTVLDAFVDAFDIDVAIGVQLDAIGEWVGVTRFVTAPIEGVFFTWDDDALGWEAGIWRGQYDTDTSLVALPDDTYRIVLRSKIAQNYFDGTLDKAYALWDGLLEGVPVAIQDNSDMSIGYIALGSLSPLNQAILTNDEFVVRPAGVELTGVYDIPTAGYVFGFDLDNDHFKGWEDAQWTRRIA